MDCLPPQSLLTKWPVPMAIGRSLNQGRRHPVACDRRPWETRKKEMREKKTSRGREREGGRTWRWRISGSRGNLRRDHAVHFVFIDACFAPAAAPAGRAPEQVESFRAAGCRICEGCAIRRRQPIARARGMQQARRCRSGDARTEGMSLAPKSLWTVEKSVQQRRRALTFRPHHSPSGGWWPAAGGGGRLLAAVAARPSSPNSLPTRSRIRSRVIPTVLTLFHVSFANAVHVHVLMIALSPFAGPQRGD